ncbi:uroporphyrinogen decarboxylase/cobalamine-independent methonine synthase family protein [Thermincola ferriacetica]
MNLGFDYSGLSTGIGSLPLTGPREATEFIMKKFADIPHWAQLPRAGEQEGFINQFIGPLTKVGLISMHGAKYYFNTDDQDWAARLGEFYAIYLAAAEGDDKALQYFAFPPDSAKGYYDFRKYLTEKGTGSARCLKGQISGLLSVGFALTDQNRRAAYYDPQIRDVLIKVLSMQGKLQARELAEFGLPVIIFVDDPGLYACGMSTHVTLKREEIIDELNAIFEQIHSAGAAVGVHSCAGMDWTILMESNLEIISFDAYEYFVSLASYSSELKQYMDRGGILAWGIVPTSEKLYQESAETLASLLGERLQALEGKGLDRDILLRQSLITPSCGTGLLTEELANKVYDITVQVSEKFRKGF